MFFFLSLSLQCKFAFSYFITPYDAQASSAFSALISILLGREILSFQENNYLQEFFTRKRKRVTGIYYYVCSGGDTVRTFL